MALTTLTTLATALPTEMIVATFIEEARPFNVAAPLVLNDRQPQGKGLVWDKPKLPTTTASAVGEETDITPAARTTSGAEITIAEVGLGTDVTDLAQETTAAGVADLVTWVQSQGRAVGQKITGDICALLSALNGGTAVGSTGVNITVANFIEAIYTLDNANAPGIKTCILHARQIWDLFAAIVAATGTVHSNLPELVREGRLPQGTPAAGFMGELLGVPTYQTTEVPTANSAADRAGGMFTREAMGFIQLRPVRAEYDRNASARTTEIIVTTAYGVGEIVDGYGVPIVTDA